MELQILLAGVEFGPYTVEQAQELLGEGFLNETDPAKRLDETDWLPLSDVLAQMLADAGESEEPEYNAPSHPGPSPEFEPNAQEVPEEFTAQETFAPLETTEEAEASMPESEQEPSSETFPNFSEESAQIPAAVPAPPPIKAAATPYEPTAPTPIASATPLIQVSLPAKAKKSMRTGSLLAQDALRAARERSGILSPIGRASAQASAPAEPPAPPSISEPTPVEPPAPRRKLQLNLSTGEEPQPEPVAPSVPSRKAIRLTGRITLPGLAPKPELSAAQPPSLSGPLVISRSARTRSELERKTTTRPLTAKEKSSFLIGQIARPTDAIREEAETATAKIPSTPLAEEKEIAQVLAPSAGMESGSASTRVQAAGREIVADEPVETEPRQESITALLQAAGTETVAEPPGTESGPLPAPTEPDLTASGSLTASGDLIDRRSLKITGPLRHPMPHTPIQLGSPSKPGDSARLPYPTGKRPGGLALPPSVVPPKEPLAPVSEESLPHRPELGKKMPVSAMPNEGVRIRARRITTTVPISDKARETEPASSRALPPPLPAETVPLSTSAKKGTSMSITPPPAETDNVVPPLAGSEQAVAPAEPATDSPPLPGPVMAAAPAAQLAEETVANPIPATPVERTADDAAKPEKVRLRRPVKLELSSRAKIQESGRLTLEAFSKLASLELPAQGAPAKMKAEAGTPQPTEKKTPTATEPVIPAGPNAEPAPADYYPPRLAEAPPLAWKSSQTRTARHWEWLSYVVITFLVVAACFIIYKVVHRPVAGMAMTSTSTASSSTNTTGVETPVPPASAAPPTVTTAPAAVTTSSPAPVPAAVSSAASAPSAGASRPSPSAVSRPTTNAASSATQPTAIVQDLNSQVDTYVGEGAQKYQKGDYAGALASYNQALNLNPKSAAALYNRGLAKAAQNDLDGAVADYSAALLNDPGMAAAYYYRGLARHSQGELDGAISDYNQALLLDPKNALAYFNRGMIRLQKGDIDGSIFDSTRALELDPRQIQSYYDRGLGRLAKDALNGSLSDMKVFCQLAPRKAYTDYARLYIWLIESRQGHIAEANQRLSKAMNSGWNGAANSMVTRIGEYLLGQIPEAELIKASASDIPVKDQGQRCEAWYFIGMRHLQAGDKQGAADDLRKCIGTQKTDYCEFILAQEALKGINPSGMTNTILPAPRAQAVTLPDPGTMATPEATASETPQVPAVK